MRRTGNPKDFGRVALLMGGWVSGRVGEVPVALRAGANARPWMAGPGFLGEVMSRHGWQLCSAEGVAHG